MMTEVSVQVILVKIEIYSQWQFMNPTKLLQAPKWIKQIFDKEKKPLTKENTEAEAQKGNKPKGLKVAKEDQRSIGSMVDGQ